MMRQPASFIWWNAASLKTRKHELRSLLSLGPRALGVGECKLSDADAAEMVKDIPGYNFIYRSHSSNSGGLLVALAKDVSYVCREDLEFKARDDGSSRTVVIDLREGVRLLFAYCQPGAGQLSASLNPFLASLRRAANFDGPVLALGDFNARHLLFGDSISTQPGELLAECCADVGLLCLNSELCPVSTRGRSILDLALASPEFLSLHPSMRVLDLLATSSDHLPVEVSIKWDSPTRDLPAPWRAPDTSDIDWAEVDMVYELAARKALDSLEDRNGRTEQMYMEYLCEVLTSVPLLIARRFLLVRGNPNRCPTRTPEIDALRQELRRKARILRDRKVPPDAVGQQAAELRRIISEKVATEEARRVVERLSSADAPRSWRQLRRLLGQQAGAAPINVKNPETGAAPRDFRESLSNLSRWFKDCFRSAEPQDLELEAKVAAFVDNLPHQASGAAPDVTPVEVQRALQRAKASSAEGADHVPALLLRRAPPSMRALLARVYTFSIRYAVIPEAWKRALITPAHKGGDATAAKAWRAIAVTSILARTLERVALARWQTVLFSRLSVHQAGFVPGRAMTEHLLTLTAAVHDAFDCHEQLFLLLLDLCRAYDSVCLESLLYRLSLFGLHTDAILWFRAFLFDREYTVRWDGVAAQSFRTKAGLPTGAICAVILFLIFMDGMANSSGALKLLAADDLKILATTFGAGAAGQVQTALDEIQMYCASWRLTLNHDKCKAMVLSRRQKVATPAFRVGGHIIPYVSELKYLGVLVDRRLSFASQRHHAIASTNQQAGYCSRTLRQLLHHTPVPPLTAAKVVRSVVAPSALYGSEIWMQDSATCCTAVDHALARILRVPLKLPRSVPSVDVLAEFGLTTTSVDVAARAVGHISRVLRTPYLTTAKAIALRSLAGIPVPTQPPPWLERTAFATARRQAAAWGLALPVEKRRIRSAKIRSLLNRQERNHLAEHGCAQYLRSDGADAFVRAAFRHETARTNLLLAHWGFVEEPQCRWCPPRTLESVEHLLMHCPHFTPQRMRLQAELRLNCGLDISLSILQGSLDELMDHQVAQVHRLSRSFLRLVYDSLYVP
jgi:exonuclease III